MTPGNRRLSRTVRFGSIRPGRRAVVTVRLSRALDRDRLIRLVGVSVRRGAGRSTTSFFGGF
jgi:hypothetical protein